MRALLEGRRDEVESHANALLDTRGRLEQAAVELAARSTAAFDTSDVASLERFFEDLPTSIDDVCVSGSGPHHRPALEMDTEEARLALSEHRALSRAVARNARGRETRSLPAIHRRGWRPGGYVAAWKRPRR
jgi:hypothetical protein